MIKLWLVIKDCDTKTVWTKYFENELEMNKYKTKSPIGIRPMIIIVN